MARLSDAHLMVFRSSSCIFDVFHIYKAGELQRGPPLNQPYAVENGITGP